MKPCQKKRFATESEAAAHNSGQSAYFCRSCAAWHLTSGMSGRLYRAQGCCSPQVAREWIKRKVRR